MRHALLFAAMSMVLMGASTAFADVVVLNNRTTKPVSLQINSEGVSTNLLLGPGQSRPFFADKPPRIQHAASPLGGDRLRLNQVYYFSAEADGPPRLRQLGLGDDPQIPLPRTPWPKEPHGKKVIPLLLAVDDEEPRREVVWKHQLTNRIKAVSKIIETHAGIKLRVAGFARYASDNRLTSFVEALSDFEQSVDPPPGHLAIGFSSQFEVKRYRRLGGTKGPLRQHLLLREWSPTVGESERTELLVHELGHYLGAAHSPESDSIMRPVLGDRLARNKKVTIQFDAVNTLAIAMVGEEIRRRGVYKIGQLSPSVRLRLGQLYATLGQTMPDDPAAENISRRVVGPLIAAAIANGAGAAARNAPEGPTLFLEAITYAAQEASSKEDRNDRDARTSKLVRSAASAGKRNDKQQRRDFLIALGFAFENSDTLARFPQTSQLAKRYDPPERRKARRKALGQPTARGRADTAKHFFASATLTAVVGPVEAELLGHGKEAIDAQGGTGYSFADLAANRAGIRFAERVLDGSFPLQLLALQFEINHFVPPLDNLPEGLAIQDVVDRYGGKGDPRYEAMITNIDRRIDALPPYILLKMGLPE